MGMVDGRIVILADHARPQDLDALRDRLRKRWQEIVNDELELETIGFPAEEAKILEMFGAVGR